MKARLHIDVTLLDSLTTLQISLMKSLKSFALYASTAKAESLGEKVEVVFKNGSIILDVVADEKIQGDIVKVPDFKSAKDVYGLFGESRYQTVTLRKV